MAELKAIAEIDFCIGCLWLHNFQTVADIATFPRRFHACALTFRITLS
jgi:hypothetical protein